jgi:hypothetical protein
MSLNLADRPGDAGLPAALDEDHSCRPSHPDARFERAEREHVGRPETPSLRLWWLDPTVALVIAVVAVREGIETWRGEDVARPVTPARSDQAGRLFGMLGR